MDAMKTSVSMPVVPTIGNPTFLVGQKFRARFLLSLSGNWVVMGLKTEELDYDHACTYEGSNPWRKPLVWKYLVSEWIGDDERRGLRFEDYGWMTEEEIVKGMELA